MRTAFVILAHKNPAQTRRLITRLTTTGNRCFVHVDANAPQQIADQTFDGLSSCAVAQVRRVASSWASWGLVEAALSGLRAAFDASDTRHFALMSAQDYPIRPIQELDSYLTEHHSTTFIHTRPIPNKMYGKDGGIGRLDYWNKPLGHFRFRVPIRRRRPFTFAPYGGAQFFCASRDMVSWILDFVDKNPPVPAFFRHSWIPDELFFPTLMLNSPLRESTRRDHLWHQQWRAGESSPQVLTSADLPSLRVSATRASDMSGYAEAKFFARKFDVQVDAGVLDDIDDWLGR